MGLESAIYIGGLVASNPVNATDSVGEGDDHLRLIKSCLLNTFPNVTGEMSLTHTQLNKAAVKDEVNQFTARQEIRSGNLLRILDAANTDRADFSHDGTDFTTDFSNTVDWNITGLSGRLLLPITRADDDIALLFGTDEDFGIDYNSAGAALIIEDRITGRVVRFSEGAAARMDLDHSASHLWLRDGYKLRVSDAGDADYVEFSHDGAGFNADFVNTSYWNIEGIDNIILRGGTGLRLNDATNTDDVTLQHDGSNVIFNTVGSTSYAFKFGGNERFAINNTSGLISVQDGFSMRIFNSTNSDYADFSHDGTDFLIAMTNTAECIFTGAGKLVVGDFSDFSANAITMRQAANVSSSMEFRESSGTAGMDLYYDGNPTPGDFHSGVSTGAIGFRDPAGARFFEVNRSDGGIYTPNNRADEVGFKGAPQSIQNGNYTLALSDAGKTIYKTTGGAGETYTIPANASVAFPLGTIIVIYNDGGGDLSIAITTDTLEEWGTGNTGTRTLADNGKAILEKVTAASWKISGIGVS